MVKVIRACWGLPIQIVTLLVMIFIQRTTANDTPICGVKPPLQLPLIHRGVPVAPGEWPWHVAVFDRHRREANQYICGGTIINADFVLSAAHCFETNPDRYFFKAGMNMLHNDSDPYVMIYNLLEIIKHPQYEPQAHKFSNDIALVRPDRVISFKTFAILPICLWPANDPSFHAVLKQEGVVVGFGLDETEKVSDMLQKALIRVVEKKDCIQKYANKYPDLHENDGKMCGIGGKNVTVCSGDSGGGLYFRKNNVWYLLGIVSTGSWVESDTGDKTCDPTVPSIYTDVSKYISWISDRQRIVDQRNLLKLDDCGVDGKPEVEDETLKPMFNQYPWNVLLEIRQLDLLETYLVCNGVLVHPRYVLTVGHCAEGAFARYKLSSVRLGEFNVRSEEDRDPNNQMTPIRYQTIDIEKVFFPNNYRYTIYSQNVALIKLKYNADTSKPNIKPICLPSVDEYKGSSLLLTGWKRNKEKFPQLEREAMNLSSTATCTREYEKLRVNLPSTENALCAAYRDRLKGHCYSFASGSPLQYIKSVDKVPRYFLAGLMVFNFPRCHTQGSEVFVSLGMVYNWIKDTVK